MARATELDMSKACSKQLGANNANDKPKKKQEVMFLGLYQYAS